MTTQDLKTRPIENGCIFVTNKELEDYIKLWAGNVAHIFPKVEIEQRCKDMLSGRRPVMFYRWQVKVRER